MAVREHCQGPAGQPRHAKKPGAAGSERHGQPQGELAADIIIEAQIGIVAGEGEPGRRGEARGGELLLETGPGSLALKVPLPPAPGGRATLSFNSPVASGALEAGAEVTLEPFAGALKFRADRLPLAPFSTLIPPPAAVSIDSGTLSLAGAAALPAGGGSNGGAGPFRGLTGPLRRRLPQAAAQVKKLLRRQSARGF